MIATSSWDVGVTVTSSYVYKEAILPTPYIAKIYDRTDSDVGISIPEIVNIARTLGTPSNTVRATNGVYAEIQMNNAYDIILLDTIKNNVT
jgi:hypothetical protein